eukprot:750111-Hanusia_phi.AAC.3
MSQQDEERLQENTLVSHSPQSSPLPPEMKRISVTRREAQTQTKAGGTKQSLFDPWPLQHQKIRKQTFASSGRL